MVAVSILRIMTTVFLSLILLAYIGIVITKKRERSSRKSELVAYYILMVIEILAIVFIWV